MDYTTIRILTRGMTPDGNQIAAFLDLDYDPATGRLAAAEFQGLLGQSGTMLEGRWRATDTQAVAALIERSRFVVQPFGKLALLPDDADILPGDPLSKEDMEAARQAMRRFVQDLEQGLLIRVLRRADRTIAELLAPPWPGFGRLMEMARIQPS